MPLEPLSSAVPDVFMRAWTSPWPCGFVSNSHLSLGSRAKAAVASCSAATLSCFIIVIWPGAAPKSPFSFRALSFWHRYHQKS